MTHQRNLILSAAVAAAFGVTAMSAHAGTGSALPAKIATAALVNNTTQVAGNQVIYSTQVPLANNTIYYVYVQLTNAVFTGAPAATLFSSSNAALSTALVGASTALSNDGTFAVYTLLATNTGVPSGIPVNTTIQLTPTGVASTAGGVTGLSALLAGGSVTETIGIGSTAQVTTSLANIDPPAAGGNIITFTAPQTYTAASSGAAPSVFTALGVGGTGPETTQINVASGTGVALTATAMTGASNTLIDFGGFVLNDVVGVKAADNTALWTIANEYTAAALAATVTGNFAAASSMYLATAANCGSGTTSSLTLNTAKTSATLAAGSVIPTAHGEIVCMLVNGTTVIPATTPAVNITLSTSTGAPAGSPISFGPSNLYSLLPNGGTVIIRAYIPAAATGYTDVVRIMNIGQVSSNISVARIDPTTGTVGTSAALTTTAVLPGAAVNFTASQIETALGGPFAASDRPRLMFTANTTIEGQNYIVNPGGVLTTLHGTDQYPGDFK